MRDSNYQSRPLSSFKDVSPQICNIVLPLNKGKGINDQTIKHTQSNESDENLDTGTLSLYGLVQNQMSVPQ